MKQKIEMLLSYLLVLVIGMAMAVLALKYFDVLHPPKPAPLVKPDPKIKRVLV